METKLKCNTGVFTELSNKFKFQGEMHMVACKIKPLIESLVVYSLGGSQCWYGVHFCHGHMLQSPFSCRKLNLKCCAGRIPGGLQS